MTIRAYSCWHRSTYLSLFKWGVCTKESTAYLYYIRTFLYDLGHLGRFLCGNNTMALLNLHLDHIFFSVLSQSALLVPHSHSGWSQEFIWFWISSTDIFEYRIGAIKMLINNRNLVNKTAIFLHFRVLFSWLCSKDVKNPIFDKLLKDVKDEYLYRRGGATYADVYKILCEFVQQFQKCLAQRFILNWHHWLSLHIQCTLW